MIPRYLALIAAILLLAACDRGQAANRADLTFPVQDPAKWVMEALIVGELVERDGCLYIEAGTSFSPIWPNGFSYEREGDGVTIFDGEGTRVVSTGDEVSMGGGVFANGGHSALPDDLAKQVGDCAGPYWIVGNVNEASS